MVFCVDARGHDDAIPSTCYLVIRGILSYQCLFVGGQVSVPCWVGWIHVGHADMWNVPCHLYN